MKECWYHNAAARLTALRIKKSLANYGAMEDLKWNEENQQVVEMTGILEVLETYVDIYFNCNTFIAITLLSAVLLREWARESKGRERKERERERGREREREHGKKSETERDKTFGRKWEILIVGSESLTKDWLKRYLKKRKNQTKKRNKWNGGDVPLIAFTWSSCNPNFKFQLVRIR